MEESRSNANETRSCVSYGETTRKLLLNVLVDPQQRQTNCANPKISSLVSSSPSLQQTY